MKIIHEEDVTSLIENAKALEKSGHFDEAIALYKEIKDTYKPINPHLYERLSILLERQGAIEEAIKVNDEALRLISRKKLNASPDHFLHRKERLSSRIQTSETSNNNSTPKTSKWQLVRFKPNIDLKNFRLRKPMRDEYIALILVFFVFALYGYSHYYQPHQNYSILMLNIDEFYNDTFSERTELIEPSEDNLPVITKSMIEEAIKSGGRVSGVRKIGITVKGDVVGIVTLLNKGGTEEDARKATRLVMNTLALEASKVNKELKAPNAVDYGGLFNYYYTIAIVGNSDGTLIDKGYKRAHSKAMDWDIE